MEEEKKSEVDKRPKLKNVGFVNFITQLYKLTEILIEDDE